MAILPRVGSNPAYPSKQIQDAMEWHKFYEKRVNSSYQEYFERRYQPFLDTVLTRAFGGGVVIDAGCGIGSVSKYLNKRGIFTVGFDLCPDMVALACKNVPDSLFMVRDIKGFESDRTVVTHGVLEHFDDATIKGILENCPDSVHYVPLDGYKEPSFGDERLLPKEFWVDTFRPRFWETFNEDEDLYFGM